MLMKTPICDFVENYARKGKLRLHMPGHKGVPFLGVEERDITEVDGADVLYNSDGIIAESEKNATELFGSGRTLYSTEGSSLCIRAMVYLAAAYAKKQGKRPVILAARNAHKTFISAISLTTAEVEWLGGDGEGLISCRVTADALEGRLCQMEEPPVAVYLTSPDYLGAVSEIGKISEVCKKYGVILMVDNAHGAYLKFLGQSVHPIDMGADICCDSAHKTLPVLTGGAYLHISRSAPDLFFDMAEQALSLFASTSPSYLILQSLDMANKYLSEDYKLRLAAAVDSVRELKGALTESGFSLTGDEELKICIEAKKYGYLGYELAEYLREKSIECEFCDRDFLVMMFTPEISAEEIDFLGKTLSALPKREAIEEKAPAVGTPKRVMTVREAMMSPSKEVAVRDALGKILAAPGVSCPPAIPIVLCGELIGEREIGLFEYYGIEKCRVVR